jgi:transcriptional regulator with XRE-family HTH domain
MPTSRSAAAASDSRVSRAIRRLAARVGSGGLPIVKVAAVRLTDSQVIELARDTTIRSVRTLHNAVRRVRGLGPYPPRRPRKPRETAVGSWLTRERLRRAMTQGACADRIGVSRRTWIRWEQGPLTPSRVQRDRIRTELRFAPIERPPDPVPGRTPVERLLEQVASDPEVRRRVAGLLEAAIALARAHGAEARSAARARLIESLGNLPAV